MNVTVPYVQRFSRAFQELAKKQPCFPRAEEPSAALPGDAADIEIDARTRLARIEN
jgi:hypothetical protein